MLKLNDYLNLNQETFQDKDILVLEALVKNGKFPYYIVDSHINDSEGRVGSSIKLRLTKETAKILAEAILSELEDKNAKIKSRSKSRKTK